MVYSFSRISTYINCPFAYKKYYLEGVKTESNSAADVGTYVHEHIRTQIQEEEMPFINLSIEGLEVAKDFIHNSEDIMLELAFRYNYETLETEQDIFINKEFKEVEPDSKDAFLRGIVDLILFSDEGIIVLDWKTGRSEPDLLQLYIYAILVEAKYGKLPKEVGFIKLRDKEIKTIPITKKAIEQVKKYLLKVIEVIENDEEFKPKVGKQCSYCKVIHSCPLANELNIPDLTSPEKVITALKMAQTLKQRAKDIEERVKEILEKEEEIKAEGYKAYYKPKTYYSFIGRKEAPKVIKEVIKRVQNEQELAKYLKLNTEAIILTDKFQDIAEKYFTQKTRNYLTFEEDK